MDGYWATACETRPNKGRKHGKMYGAQKWKWKMTPSNQKQQQKQQQTPAGLTIAASACW